MAEKLKIPHTYVIVFVFIILAAVLTWILRGMNLIEKLSM